MKNLAFILLIASALQSSAFAQNEISSPSVKLLGSGIMNRKTKEVVSFVCVGEPVLNSSEPNCHEVRLAGFHQGRGYFLSPPIELSPNHEPLTDEVASEALKLKLSSVFHEFENWKPRSRGNRTIRETSGVAAVAGGLILLPVGLAPLGIGLFTAGIVYLLKGTPKLRLHFDDFFDPEAGISQRALLSKDGWNWSSQPRKLSHKNFIAVGTFIRDQVKTQ